MDAQQQLFGLMAVAEEHQKAVNAALDGLTAERAALAKERAALAAALAQQTEAVKSAAGSVSDVGDSIRQAASDAIPAIRRAAGEAVGASVRQSLAGASDAAAKALGEASRPIVMQLSGVVKAASEAEGKLSGAVAAFGWRWAMLAGGAAAGGIAAVLLAAWLAVWWQRHQVERLAEQKAALQADVAQMQASVKELEKRGGRIVMTTCGGRLCIEASKDQGGGGKSGVWRNKETGVQFVIPKGY